MRLATLVAAITVLILPMCAHAQSIQVLPRNPTDPVAVTIEQSPGHTMDWVTITPSGAPDFAYVDWFYLNGAKWAPAVGSTTSTVTFPAPPAGTYTVRLYGDNKLANKLGISAVITVGGVAAPTSTPTAGTIMFNGDSITAPNNITGAQNWTAIVATKLGYANAVNLAANDKYSSGVLQEAPQMSGEVCMVMIGTNDMIGSVLSGVTAEVSRIGYLANMRQVIYALKSRCGRVVIISPPLSMNARETLRYPAVVDGLRLICVEYGVTFLDLFHHMADLSAIESESVVQSWYSDWRHLTPAGHAVIAEFVAKSVKVTP